MHRASGFIFDYIQQSNDGVSETKAEHVFESYANSCGVKIKHYHADNQIFNSVPFKESCIAAQKQQTLCGINAHHENGVV